MTACDPFKGTLYSQVLFCVLQNMLIIKYVCYYESDLRNDINNAFKTQ